MRRSILSHPLSIVLVTFVFLLCAFLLTPRPYLPSTLPLPHLDPSRCLEFNGPDLNLPPPATPLQAGNCTFVSSRDANNHALTTAQCEAAFPGLFDDIDKSADNRYWSHITEHELDKTEDELRRKNIAAGTIRVMIYESQVYIINHMNAFAPKFGSRTLATLHALDRAIHSDLEFQSLPNIEFLNGVADSVNSQATLWGYARHEQDETWLMPDFNYWSWPEPRVGSYAEGRRRIEEVEKMEKLAGGTEAWEKKIPKVFWRGSMHVSPGLRNNLMNATRNEEWADVEELIWSNPEQIKQQLKPIEDHCRYQFIVHTEGHSFSGRLKYIQHCESIILMHPLDWYQPTQRFFVDSGPKQNYVSVSSNFSDLEEKILELQEDPAWAHTIIRNSLATFRDRYLTPAAESCYWRKLIRGYGTVAFRPRFYENADAMDEQGRRRWRGVPWESFALMKELKWEPH